MIIRFFKYRSGATNGLRHIRAGRSVLLGKTLCFSRLLMLTLLLMLLPFSPAYSGAIENDMRDFWDNFGGLSNVTSSRSYETQAAGHYSLGNVYLRSRSKNLQLASIQLPELRAGCGGIDIFAGSFSFVNSDQLVAMGKAIATNAVGFAFKLALETISPKIGQLMTELQDLANKVNSLNMNSCEAAAGLVGSLWPKTENASQHVCRTLGSSSGLFSDFAAGRHGCGPENRSSETIEATKEEAKDVKVENVNLVWQAMNDSDLLSGISSSLRELFMSITGTLIVKGENNDVVTISSKATDDKLVRAILHGGSYDYNKCNDSDKCLEVSAASGTILSEHSYVTRVRYLLNSIKSKIESDTALNTDEEHFLNSSNLPLYKILEVHVLYSGSADFVELESYSEIIALDILYKYYKEIIRNVSDATNNFTLVDQAKMDSFKSSLYALNLDINNEDDAKHRRFAALNRLLNRTLKVEQLVTKNMSSISEGPTSYTRGLK